MSVEIPIELVPDASAESESSPGKGTVIGEGLAKVKEQVVEGRLQEARALVRELEARWPSSAQVQYWARVLAPPIVRRVTEADARSRSFEHERRWLHEHASEYPGQWLALYEGRLIAAHPDLEVVLVEKRRTPEGRRALLHFEPGEPHLK